jgi:hypothetical protein
MFCFVMQPRLRGIPSCRELCGFLRGGRERCERRTPKGDETFVLFALETRMHSSVVF